MAKKDIKYQVSMEELKSFAAEDGRKNMYRPGFSRLKDYDYRRFFAKRMLIYLFLAAFCVAFMLFLSVSTSPLYTDYCDGDSSIFMLIGKGITLGKRVYADYFDHKGPILFYLNALGFFLNSSKSGVLIVQCVLMSLTAIFMFKTARIFTKTVRSIICVIITVLAFAATISDGNLSEEYCLLFCMIPIYLSLKHYTRSPKDKHPPLYMGIYGMCFAVCAFIRINNGIMIGGIVLVALITDFAQGYVKNAFKNLLAFFIGFAAVAVPICVFFIAKGSFSDMIFATFTFNFLYASEGSSIKTAETLWEMLRWILPVLSLLLITTLFAKRLGARVASIIAAISVFALIPALMGFAYTHYYTTLIPLVLIYCAIFFYIATQRITFWSVLLCIVMIVPVGGYFASAYDTIIYYADRLDKQNNPVIYSDMHTSVHYSAETLSALIPEEDRDSVFGYDISAAWFLEADIMPCFRLFTLQESWAEHYGEFGREINQMMIDTPPKWLVIHNKDIIESRQLLNIIDENYEFVSEFGYDLLLKHKENGSA